MDSHLQTTQSHDRLTLLDSTQKGSPKWDVNSAIIVAREDEGPYTRFHPEVEYEHLEYDGNDPAMWAVGKEVIWSLKGDMYEGQVDRTTARMDKMDMEILVR